VSYNEFLLDDKDAENLDELVCFLFSRFVINVILFFFFLKTGDSGLWG